MAVNNDVDITGTDVIDHLKFIASSQDVLRVYDNNGQLYIGNGTDYLCPVTVENNVITFGYSSYSYNLASYIWE